MITNPNGATKDFDASPNHSKRKDNKEIDQIINALIKENEILTKASKDNTYTSTKVLNDLLKVLYIQRNQLNSLEEENNDLEQSISQLHTTINNLENKNSKVMLKTQPMIQNTLIRYTNNNGDIKQYQQSFNPNGCLSFTDLKNKLKPNETGLETSYNSLCNLSTSSFQRKTLKPINQSHSYQK